MIHTSIDVLMNPSFSCAFIRFALRINRNGDADSKSKACANAAIFASPSSQLGIQNSNMIRNPHDLPSKKDLRPHSYHHTLNLRLWCRKGMIVIPLQLGMSFHKAFQVLG